MAFKGLHLENWKKNDLRLKDKYSQSEVKYREKECFENNYKRREAWDDIHEECWQEKENFPSVLTRSRSKMIANRKMDNGERLFSSGSKLKLLPEGTLPLSTRKVGNTMNQQVKISTSNSNGYFDKLYGIKTMSWEEKKLGFEKVRHIFERAREQRRTAILKSRSKTTPGKLTSGTIPTPLRISQKSHERTERSQHSRKYLGILLSGDCKTSQRLNNAEEFNVEPAVPSKECCRELKFESEDEDASGDHTTPLNMMDITSMIRGASFLQVPYQDQEQPKENHQPKIKKNLLSFPTSNLLMRKTHNYRNKQNKSDESQSNVDSKPEKKVAFKIDSQDIHGQSNQEDFPKSESLFRQDEVKKKNYNEHIVNVDSSKNVRSGKEQKSPRKIIKRRSIVTPSIRAPLSRIAKQNSGVKSTTKIPSLHGVHPSHKKPSQRKSLVPTNHIASSYISSTRIDQKIGTGIPRIVVSLVNDPEPEDQEAEKDVIICKADKCDASTNTTVKFVCGQYPSTQLRSEIENLVSEQEELIKKGELLLEQTCARRKQMKESRIMESFTISLSPLRRLQAMLKEREEYSAGDPVSSTSHKLENSSADESLPLCAASVLRETYSTPENNNTGCVTPNTDVQESSRLNTASNLNVSHTQWNQLEQENRFFQTPSRYITQMSVQPEDENSFKNVPKDKSPFTKMVGDCERPSLAPMTPHSRQQVSQLKLCLKKQLEELYD